MSFLVSSEEIRHLHMLIGEIMLKLISEGVVGDAERFLEFEQYLLCLLAVLEKVGR